MKYSPSWIMVIVGMALGSIAQSKPPVTERPPIRLDEIRERGVQGKLGVRLGKIVTVAGKVVPNKFKDKASASYKSFLAIDTVNGKALIEPVLYPFSKKSALIEIQEPKIGERFQFIGYESGGFEGLPEGLSEHMQPVPAMQGYYFSTHFSVVAATDTTKTAK